MASEAVKKILSAEAVSAQKNADARSTAEEIVREAERNSALAIQKKITLASSEIEKIRTDYMERLDVHARQAEKECAEKMAEISRKSEENMEKAVSAVIKEFF